MIYIDRSDSKKAQESIAVAASLIEAGKHVIIFPEGTKSKDGKIGPFKKGGFHLAQQANVAILPIKIEGAQFVWPNKKPFSIKTRDYFSENWRENHPRIACWNGNN